MNRVQGISDRRLRRFIKSAAAVAAEAGKLLKRNVNSKRSVRRKGAIDLVTEMDVASEKLIVGKLQSEYPEFSFLTEEAAAIDTESEFRWIVDPLDGTTNYTHGFPFWCVSIGLEYRGRMIVGVVYDANLDELFTAAAGLPTRLNGKPIRVTSRRKLSESLLATGFPYDIQTSKENNLNYFNVFARRAQAVRRAGSAALDLCYLAAGRFDGFWELKLHPWDTAAAIVIVEQAGGRVTDFCGKRYSIFDKYILATNGKIHREMQKLMSENC
ncbi:MAG: inositol monophosphatase family protein [bacterium]